MKYKILIFLFILVLIFVLIYREFSTFKEDMVTSLQMEYSHLQKQLETNLIKCVTQIKSISHDNLQQFRKISLLNNQQIKKVNNHFTEDDDSAVYTDVANISDAKHPNPITKTGTRPSNHDIAQYYMSDENDHDNDTGGHSATNPASHNTDPIQPDDYVCTGDICKRKEPQIPIYEQSDDHAETISLELQSSIPLYNPADKPTDKPVDKPVDKPADNPANKPVDNPTTNPDIPKSTKKPTIHIDTAPILNPIDTYKYKDLQDLAKKNGIPLTQKDNTGKMRIHKKNELYDIICSAAKSIPILS